MLIRIVKSNIRWLLCVGFKREIGRKNEGVKATEPFLFFTPDTPNKQEREAVMVALAELFVERSRAHSYTLVGVKILDFKESFETVSTSVHFADVFGTEKEWRENLKILVRQRKMRHNRITGYLEEVKIDFKTFIAKLAASAPNAA